jgi:hypothetical protein
VDDQLRERFLKIVPVGIVDAADLYLPAMGRLGLQEMFALAELVDAKRSFEAMKAVRATMTADELTAEKSKLADLAEKMAADNADALSLGRAITLAILKTAFLATLGGVGL